MDADTVGPPDVPSFIRESSTLFDTLLGDLKLLSDIKVSPENKGSIDRANIRTIFAVFEALSHFLRAQALVLHKLGHSGLTPSQVKDLDPDLRLTMRENLKISLGAIAALRNPKMLPIDFNKSQGWSHLLAIEAARDRITHPKNVDQLKITDSEVKSFNQAIRWYFRQMVQCLGLDMPPHLL